MWLVQVDNKSLGNSYVVVNDNGADGPVRPPLPSIGQMRKDDKNEALQVVYRPLTTDTMINARRFGSVQKALKAAEESIARLTQLHDTRYGFDGKKYRPVWRIYVVYEKADALLHERFRVETKLTYNSQKKTFSSR